MIALDIRVQLKDGSVFEIPYNDTTTAPTRQMFFVKDINGKVWELNSFAIKTYVDYKLCLFATKKIFDAIKSDGFFGKFVYGDLRSGKSVYTLHILSEVYGDTWEEKNICYNVENEYALPTYFCKERDWFAFKKHMIFLPSEFDEAHKRVVEEGLEDGRKSPLLVWDDAGVWINKRFFGKEWAKNLIRQLQVIGTAFASIIFTSPSYEELLKGIRELPSFRWGHPDFSMCRNNHVPFKRSIKVYTTKSQGGRKWVQQEYQDIYGKMDQEAFDEYQKIRRGYLKKMYEEISEKWGRDGEDGEWAEIERLLAASAKDVKPEEVAYKKYPELLPPPKPKKKRELGADWRYVYHNVDLDALDSDYLK